MTILYHISFIKLKIEEAMDTTEQRFGIMILWRTNMYISHKMTVSDKLREIRQEKRWSQKELAGKLRVSEKTMSFWINGKKQPARANLVEIDKLYHELVDTPRSEVKEEIQEFQAKMAVDEVEKSLTLSEKTYYEAKCYCLAKEKTNCRYVYLFPSVGKEVDGWYKVGGRSLLFYKNLLAPRLGREAKLRDDHDRIHRFDKGIVSVRWGNKLMAEAVSLGYSAKRIEYDIIMIDLNKDYSEAEIRTMAEAIKRERNKVKKMVKPKANYPSIVVAINKLIQVLPSKVKKLDKSYREVWSAQLLSPLIELTKIYFRFANGRMEQKDAKLEMLSRVDDLGAMIYMMDEAGMLDITARTRLGENVCGIRQEIEENL